MVGRRLLLRKFFHLSEALLEATQEADVRESQGHGQGRHLSETLPERKKTGPLEHLPGVHEALVSTSNALSKQMHTQTYRIIPGICHAKL